LLHIYPLDKADPTGKLFWSSPKRPPSVCLFNADDAIKLKFIISTALLHAHVHNIVGVLPSDVVDLINQIEVPVFEIDSTKVA
jgi:hypothetical protein